MPTSLNHANGMIAVVPDALIDKDSAASAYFSDLSLVIAFHNQRAEQVLTRRQDQASTISGAFNLDPLW